MDKNVYNMKAEKIQKHVKQGDYEGAEKICDTIEWNQVRSARMLSLVSSVYEHVGKYDKAIDILLMAYEEAPVGRRLLYKLTELALAAKEIRDAEEYYKSYLVEAPDDNSRYVLRYKIAEAKGEPIEKKISILEAYKRQEFDEQWSYKLAELYAEKGLGDKCAKLCDEIILWFGVGQYVDKALELKERFAPLTDEQLNHRNDRAKYEDSLRDVQREFSDVEDIPEDIAAVLARSVAEENARTYEEEPTTEALEEEVSKKDEMPEVAITDDTPAATESGQVISSLDKSAFLPEDDEVRINLPEDEEEEDVFANTRRVSEKSDFAKTRIYDRKPGDETRIMKPISDEIVAEETSEPANVASAEATEATTTEAVNETPEEKPTQVEFIWEEETPREPVEKIIFLGTDFPSEAVEIAVEEIKKSHRTEGTRIGQITKIPAMKLNTKGVINSLEALKGKDLIILGASALDDAIIDEIQKVTEMFDKDKFFVLADSKQGIESAKARFKKEEIVEEPEEIPDVNLSDYFYDLEEPAAEEPAAEEPVVEEPVVEEPVVEEPVVEEPVVEESVVEEPMAEEPVAEEPVAEEPVIEDPVFDEPAADEVKIKDVSLDGIAIPSLVSIESTDAAEKTSLSTDEFLSHIKKYMEQIDCVFEEGAEESVKKYIETLASEGETLDAPLAVDMVEDAADMAEKHGLGNLFKSKYDKTGRLILRGKNFE